MKFTKMSGAGNDFILFESRALPRNISRAVLARRLCPRRGSVGADGILVVAPGDGKRLPELDYYNADGSRAFCGNGSRCAAWWMHRRGWVGKRFVFRTIEGEVEAIIRGEERVRLRMPEAKNVRLGLKISAAGKTWLVHSINTGVPHAVIEVRKLDTFPVVEIGRALRNHRAFAPAGTNVNFIKVDSRAAAGAKPHIYIRTYERGVEDETLACGSGVTAAAICAHLFKGLEPPICLHSKGEDVLKVGFHALGNISEDESSRSRSRGALGTRFKDIWLEGPAKITFEGEIRS